MARMAKSLLCKITFIVFVFFTFGNCADNVTTTLTTTSQPDKVTSLSTNNATFTTVPSTEVPVTYPSWNPKICLLPCGKDGQGCQQCSDAVFECNGKQLKSVCWNYFNEATVNVTDLNLENNHFSDFQSFPGTYPNVTELKLSSNKFTKITKEDLAKFPGVKTLDLSHNNLTTIPENLFEGLPNLEQLVMRSTGLNTIPDNIFKLNKKLHFVDIQGNKLLKFPRNIFKPVWNRMTSLKINENPIEKIVLDDFEYLTNLELLHMERLDVVSLESHTFSTLTKLQEISLDHNSKLTYISEDAFGMYSHRPGEMTAMLEKVSLRACGLQRLDKHVFELRNMKELGLSGNPWLCDCDVKWMVEPETLKLFPDAERFKRELDHTYCQDLAHRGIPILKVPLDHFICMDQRIRDSSRFSSGMGGVTTVLVITFLICIIAIIFVIFMFRRREHRRSTGQHKHETPTSVSQYRAIYNQGNVQTHEEGFVDREKDPFDI